MPDEQTILNLASAILGTAGTWSVTVPDSLPQPISDSVKIAALETALFVLRRKQSANVPPFGGALYSSENRIAPEAQSAKWI